MNDKERIEFLMWAERTHAAYLNRLKKGWERYKEGTK